MLERRDEFIQLAFEETTSSKFWASKNVDIAAEALDETASLATALTGSIAPIEHGTRSYIERIPYGVVFGIARKSRDARDTALSSSQSPVPISMECVAHP